MTNKIIRLPGKITVDQVEGINNALSSEYAPSTDVNSALSLSGGDTYEVAFGKLEKAIEDNSLVVATSLNELNSRLTDVENMEIPTPEISSSYATASGVNEDLFIQSGDTYEEAFGKLEKVINDNELITAHAISELSQNAQSEGIYIIEVTVDGLGTIEPTYSYDDDSLTYNIVSRNIHSHAQSYIYLNNNTLIPLYIIDNDTNGDEVFSFMKTSLEYNTNSGENEIKAIILSISKNSLNNEKISIYSNIIDYSPLISGGEYNVIETVKVNGTALTPDANKAVDIPLVSASGAGVMSIADKEKLDGIDMSNVYVDSDTGQYDGLLYLKNTSIAESGMITIGPNLTENYIQINPNGIELNVGNGNTVDYNGNEVATVNQVNAKQDTLVSGNNIKTINNQSLLGSGDITIKANVQSDWNATTGDAVILNKPTIPAAVTESTVSGWGFTKNTGTVSSLSDLGITATATELNYTDGVTSNIQTQLNAKGTYSKPSGGIPKSDLASGVQASLDKADTALQSYTETDPTVPSYVKNITQANITSWNNKLDSAPVTSVNGMTGAVSLSLGDTNVIETVKVNGTALTPDSNKAVDITVPTAVTESTVSGWGFTKNQGQVISVNGATGVVTVTENVQSDWNATTGDAVILNKPTIPTVNDSTVTITMNGNTVTTFTLNNSGNITIDLGTVLTSHQSLKTINGESIAGTGNITISGSSGSGLPTVTAADNGKVLMVVSGAWQMVTPVSLYSGSGTPSNSSGNNGDIYVQS